MFSLLTCLPCGTKPREVKRAQAFAPDVPFRATRSQRTEPPFVVGAGWTFGRGGRVVVQVIAVVARGAVTPGEVGAVGATADVVFVQEVAAVALLAEPLQPVLADQVVRVRRRRVLVRTEGPQGAVTFAEGFAVRSGRGDAEAMFFAEEGEEGEVVGRLVRGFGGGLWS